MVSDSGRSTKTRAWYDLSKEFLSLIDGRGVYDSKDVRGSDVEAQGWEEGVGTQWNIKTTVPVGTAHSRIGDACRPVGTDSHVRSCAMVEISSPY